MSKILPTLSLVCFAFLSLPISAHALSKEGHETVCHIAYLELNDAARAKVDALLETAEEGENTLARACTWPDRVARDTMPQFNNDHFINVPRTWKRMWRSKCHNADRCLFTAITRDKGILKDSSASDEEQLNALRFLGHWVGDIHQPLHVSYKDDRGGNSVELADSIGCAKKLHAVWDNCIPRDMMMDAGLTTSNTLGFAQALRSEITKSERSKWKRRRSLARWATESLKVTRSADVQYCILNGKTCQYDQDRVTYTNGSDKKILNLTGDYEDLHAQTMRLQLKRAGVRLGHMLNKTLD